MPDETLAHDDPTPAEATPRPKPKAKPKAKTKPAAPAAKIVTHTKDGPVELTAAEAKKAADAAASSGPKVQANRNVRAVKPKG